MKNKAKNANSFDYNYVLSSLGKLGYGFEVNRLGPMHLPMAYGFIAMAGAIHCDISAATQASDWLINNSSSQSKIGWGLNWVWDSFSKGFPNPANTIYGVTTAIVVDGLYRTYLLTEKEIYLNTAIKALDNYAENHLDENGVFYFYYSDQAADSPYSVPNVTAMLMAQYAVVGHQTKNSFFMDLAKKAYLSLIKDGIEAKDYTYWHYAKGVNKLRANDLIHASFIIYGIYQFLSCFPNQHSILERAANYLEGFMIDGKIMEFHRDSLTEKQLANPVRARLWGIGMTMFLGKLLNDNSLFKSVRLLVKDYEFTHGQFSYQYGDTVHSPRSVACLLLGLA